MELQCVVTGEERDVSSVTYTWEKVRDQMDSATASVSGPTLSISPLAVTDRQGWHILLLKSKNSLFSG